MPHTLPADVTTTLGMSVGCVMDAYSSATQARVYIGLRSVELEIQTGAHFGAMQLDEAGVRALRALLQQAMRQSLAEDDSLEQH